MVDHPASATTPPHDMPSDQGVYAEKVMPELKAFDPAEATSAQKA